MFNELICFCFLKNESKIYVNYQNVNCSYITCEHNMRYQVFMINWEIQRANMFCTPTLLKGDNNRYVLPISFFHPDHQIFYYDIVLIAINIHFQSHRICSYMFHREEHAKFHQNWICNFSR